MLVAAALATVLFATPPPALTSETVADEPARATSVSAYGRYSAWSRWDRRARRYRLVVRRSGGEVIPAPVAPRKVPFDVDLGPSPGGDPVAVYSRCRREPRGGLEINPLPDWHTARGCRLFELRLPDGRERQLGLRGHLPSLWRHRVAFVRGPGADPTLVDLRTRVARALPGGPRGAGDDPLFQDPGASALDLRGRRLAFTWSHYGEFCPHPSEGLTRSNALYSEIRVATPGGGSRRLGRACLDVSPSFVLLAGWRGDDVAFARTTFTLGPAYASGLSLRDAAARRPRVDLGGLGTDRSNLLSLALSGRRVLYSRQDYDGRRFRDRVVEGPLRRVHGGDDGA